MIKFMMVILLLLSVPACRTTFEKRVNKDIAGINEQLYDVEKEQIKVGNQVQEIKEVIPRLRKEIDQRKKIENQDNPDKVYKDGYKYYLEQKYAKAIELLSGLTGKFADNPLTGNALYWQAESYYKLNNVDQALNYYQLIYRYFPFSNKADYSLYKIGTIYLDRKDNARALLAFRRLVDEYSGSDLYKAASIKITQIKKMRRKR